MSLLCNESAFIPTLVFLFKDNIDNLGPLDLWSLAKQELLLFGLQTEIVVSVVSVVFLNTNSFVCCLKTT